MEQRLVGAGRYSYETRRLDVRLASGRTLVLFLKDFGASRLPKDEPLRQRRERERWVYQRALAGAETGAPAYYGSVWDEGRGRFWLLLEFVEGDELAYCPLDDWVAAAAWLGRFQRRMAEDPERFADDGGLLVRHDADFFLSAGERARAVVAEVSADLARRLDPVLRSYERHVGLVTVQPTTLVHGAYRPHNVLVARAPDRIAPTDWESAALGTPLYDFACLADGFEPPQVDRLWDAFRAEAPASSVCSDGDRDSLVRYVRLYRVMYWLGLSLENGDAPAHTERIVRLGEALSEPLHVA